MAKNQKKPRKTAAEHIREAYDAKGSELTTRERDVVERYYAFNGYSRHTLEEIAKHYDITRERARQIKFYALQKIGLE